MMIGRERGFAGNGWRLCLAVWLCAMLGVRVNAGQSNNVGISVVPAPATVKIDGDLGDWDFSGRIWVFADKAIASRYSTETAAMWDADHLYVAIKWKDPQPLFNAVDPKFSPQDSWRGDAVQMRFMTDRFSWVTAWHYTPGRQSAMLIEYGRNATTPGGGPTVLLTSEPDSRDLGKGVEMAFRVDGDGRGYVQEMRIPWAVLWTRKPEVQAGTTIRLGLEFLWGDPTGKTRPVHRYADNLQPGKTSREFFWKNYAAWGDAELVARGNLSPRAYVDEEGLLKGTIPIRLAIPVKAARFTVAINDKSGNRVRNLAGDFLPEDYTVSVDGDRRTVEVKWDGLDDQGTLVPAGEYSAVGLSHDGLGAEFDASFYNPGTPPWPVRDGSGGWGADHYPPDRVGRAGDHMIVSWLFAEGGSGIIGIGPDGRKKWGDKLGAVALAADEKYVYIIDNGWHGAGSLCRLDAKDGSYQPFFLDGQPRPFKLDLKDVLGPAAEGIQTSSKPMSASVQRPVTAMAVHDGQLAIATANGKLSIVDASTAKALRTLDLPDIRSMAFDPAGRLLAVRGGKVQRIGIATGDVTDIATPGVTTPGSVAVNGLGEIAVADLGDDSNIKILSSDGRLLRTAGRKGGRPIRGAFDPQAMKRVSSIAFDSAGMLWAVENWNYPRRISLWGADGKLVRDYIGNSAYAGSGAFLHPTDPTIAYNYAVEMKLDRAANTYAVTQILWVPDPAKGEAFEMTPSRDHWFASPRRFTSDVSGKSHDYIHYWSGAAHAIYMKRGDAWQPVAALTNVDHLSKVLPDLPLGDRGKGDGVIWNDLNEDAAVTVDECTFVKQGWAINGNWGTRPGDDLVFYLATRGRPQTVRYAPTNFTAKGAPIYGESGMSLTDLAETGDFYPLSDRNQILCLSNKGYPEPTTGVVAFEASSGKKLWSYPNPFPGVHGSHRAPMPRPGLIIGPLKICGVADIGGEAGSVFLLRGNLGQDFVLTTDGLFVGALFQDTRLPAEAFAEKLDPGTPVEQYSQGGEPFNGWFGRQSDGVVRMACGMGSLSGMVLRMNGLESIRRFDPVKVTVTDVQVATAAQEQAARKVAAGADEKVYGIRPLASRPTIDGKTQDWPADHPSVSIGREGSPDRAIAMLAYDQDNLYVRFDVRESSPMRNEGKDFTRLFKTGDAVDVQIGMDASVREGRSPPRKGDLRLIFSMFEGKPAAVVMQPVAPGFPRQSRVTYTSPVGDRRFDRVDVLADANVAIQKSSEGYVVEASVPLKSIGFELSPGQSLRGDLGFISSDADGLVNVARTYWSNADTNLVNDLPSEAAINPAGWGEFVVQGK